MTLAATLFDLTLVQTTLGDLWQMILVGAVAGIIILPALFLKSPFGVMSQIAGFLVFAGSLYIAAMTEIANLNTAIVGIALGTALMAIGAIPQQIAKMRDESHLQNLRLLKLMAAQNKQKSKSIREQVQGDS